MDIENQVQNILIEYSFVTGECNCRNCRRDRIAASKEKIFNKYKIKRVPFYCKGYSEEHLIYYTVKSAIKWKDYPFHCEFCGKGSYGLSDHLGYRACENCVINYTSCDECGEICHPNNSYRLVNDNDKRLCGECYQKSVECVACGLVVPPSRSKEIRTFEVGGPRGQGRSIGYCKKCIKIAQIHKCDGCGVELPRGFLYEHAYDSLLCKACREEAKVYHKDYRYKPVKFHFHSWEREAITKNTMFMGWEIEVANYNEDRDAYGKEHQNMRVIKSIKDKHGNNMLWAMYDGTIQKSTGMPGFELVSHPFTWNFWNIKGKDMLDDILLKLRTNNIRANAHGLGFHVHTTKSAWLTFQIYKLFKFVYNNESFINLIAQREPNRYCNYEDSPYIAKVAKDKKNYQRTHYGSINMNKSDGTASDTIEFRMFQGKLEPLYVHKNIEFIYACYLFTLSDANMNVESFLRFTNSHVSLFPALNEFLRMKGIC